MLNIATGRLITRPVVHLRAMLSRSIFIVRAKKQLWATSLCHSLIRYTSVELSLCYAIGVTAFVAGDTLHKAGNLCIAWLL